MKFNLTSNYLKSNLDSCIITGIFKDYYLFPATECINKMSQGYISSLLKRNLFYGEIGNTLLLYDAPYFLNRKILLIGCGQKDKFTAGSYKKVIHKVIELCKKEFISKILLLLIEFDIKGYDSYWKIRHTISLFNKELYTFNQFKTNTINTSYKLNEVLLYINSANELKICEKAILDGSAIAKGINLAKDLSNMPPNYCTPVYLSNQVQSLPKKLKNLSVEILDESAITKLGMNAYLSVGKGSSYSSRMPIIKYYNNPNNINTNPIVLIGKGLTFDSGGISIKSSERMDEMKYDMCGAAVVYAVMCIISELNLPLHVIGILAVSENMINDKSVRPGDILTTLSGQTVEVLNTDAEGRLVLCDVLTYVERYNPSIVIDIATLTGACIIALGHYFSGLMSNNDVLAGDLLFASKQTRDYAWRLPINKAFDQQLESNFADMTNVGGKDGSIITAACFLKKFANKYRWAHLDIAGTAWYSNNRDKSSTGRPVELLSQFLINTAWSSKID